MKTIRDLNIKGKRVLVRCDFNVPLSTQTGLFKERSACNAMRSREILDDFRIKQILPTINYLLKNKAKIILMSHLGRPEGRIVESLKMDSIQVRLTEYLDVSITKAQDCIGKEIEEWTKKMEEEEILILENLRFHKEEEENDRDFAKALSEMGDIYINEAFGVCHRSHASITGITEFLPSVAGFLLEKEIKELSTLLDNPKKPMVAVIGGAKAETKAKVINKILKVADWVLSSSLIQKGIFEQKIKIENSKKIIFPEDEIGEGRDIGPKTIELFKEKISEAKTIFWNGPFGRIEEKEFSGGTAEIARAIARSNAYSVIGGGETVEFANKLNLLGEFNYVSTGGGAMLEFLSGEKLPGIEVLK
jgi:phosphoglycerate kinase